MRCRVGLVVALFLGLATYVVGSSKASPECIHERSPSEISMRYQDAAPNGSDMERRGQEIDSAYANRQPPDSRAHIGELDSAADQFRYTFDCASGTFRPKPTPTVTERPVVVGVNTTTTTTRVASSTTTSTKASSTTTSSTTTSTTFVFPTSIGLGVTTGPPMTFVAAEPTGDSGGGPPWPLLIGALAVIGLGVVVHFRDRTSTRGLGRI